MNVKNDGIRKIGVWMDHSEAKLIEPEKEVESIRTIHCGSSGRERFPGESPDGIRLGHYRSSNKEYNKHRREENANRDYFESLMTELKAYDKICLFGPTTATYEFSNYLSGKKGFTDKKINIQKTDYLTNPQLFKMVKEYFSTHLEN